MSSLKMTFSLTSLILIFALAAMPVMAHGPGVTPAAIPVDHNHPVNIAIADDPTTVGVTENVATHNSHPVVKSITLKGDNTRGTMAAVTDTTIGTTDIFTLVIEFDQPVVATGNLRVIPAAADETTSPLQTADFSEVVLNVDGTDATGTVEIADATRVANTNNKFEAVATLSSAFPSGTADANDKEFTFKVVVNANAVFSLATVPLTTEVPGGNSLASSAYTFTLVNALGDAPTPTTGTEGKITGDASLENPFPITITFAKAGVALTAADILVTGGGRLSEGSLYDATPDDVDDMTVWKAAVEPFTNAAQSFGFITITLNTTATVKPAAADMGGELTVRADGDLVSITAPEGANDEALFVVTLTFATSLADTVNVMASDLKVTPEDDETTANVDEGAEIGAIVAVPGTDRKMWQVEITPVKGMDTKVELSDMGKVKFGASTASATVKVKGAPPSVPDVIDAVDATYDATKDETTLTGMLAANGFAVVVAEDLPDLQRFFAEGGSISVLSAKDGAVAKDVVISEIMWGLNLRAIGDDRTAHQFIELYNTTGATIDLKDIKLTFDDANTPSTAPTGMTLLDQISNVDGVGWVITAAPGSSGRIALPDDVTTFVPSDLVSMYRKIDYAKVEKTHNADDAAANRTAQLADFPGGNAIGSWAPSNAADTYGVNLIGSPGAKHFVAYSALTPTEVKRDMFIINEIGNYDNDAHDWIEIKRVGSLDNLKKWRLSQVTSDKKDTKLVSFPDSDDPKISIPAVGDVLLIVNSDPYQDPNHPLAAGIGLNAPAKDRAETTGVTSRYYVDSGLKLANSGKTLLILRNSIDDAHVGTATSIQDVVGTLSIVDNAAGLRTSLWPLVATGAPHADVINDDAPADDEDFSAGHVYVRTGDTNGTGEHSFNSVGYTGLGYKRSAANSFQNGGTPGYPNDARINTDAALSTAGGTISISEIMYAKNRSEPQWIELYNSSMTHAVNIEEWKLKIEHSRDVDDIDIRTSVTTNNFGGGITIQPNQTVLIVSNTTGRTSRSSQGGLDFPSSRVINLWAQKDKLEVASGKTRLTYRLLSQTAFRLTLLDKDGATVDVAGNLEAEPAWELPANDVDGGRSSIIRRYNEGEATSGGEGMPIDGTLGVWSGGKGAGGMAGDSGWVYAATSHLDRARFNETYYGNPDDIGTPGYRGGGPLPVSLSKFRPERLESGEVVIRWATESELNNAGFNILRSDTRNGEFTKVNTSLIAGHGTTSERNTYEWKDTSAKPNVVYYYQIQDVSLDGDVNILRQSRLKGDVSPAGKLTTTWGELKALQ